MKNNRAIITSSLALVLLCSCATTPSSNKETNHLSDKNHKTETQIEIVEETPEEKFLKSLEGITIAKVSSPKEITKGRNFSEPFVFSATKADGTPVEGLELSILYPASKTDGVISYSKIQTKTDAEGKVSFTATQPAFAANAKVVARPTAINDSQELADKLEKFTARADWKVKSDIASKGAVLFIWDFNEKNRPVNNSSNIQGEFRGRGITMVGNGPVNETSYIGNPKALYKDTYDIIGGNQYGYLIYGTIKFEEPVTAAEDGSGYYCVLKAEIEAVSMKNGNKIYSSAITYKEIGKNWNECVSKGKDKLSQLVVDDIIYGL